MIKVEKNFDKIPNIFTIKPSRGNSRESAFKDSIKKGKYTGKNLYKVESVQKVLNSIYNLKCAYCEQKLLDTPKHIEHYRPKDIYYWLAFSWDNLLLSCGSCNSSKGSKFLIEKARIIHTVEKFKDIHNLSDDYDLRESPMIINPEKDDILNDIIFDKSGKITSFNRRVLHTIDNACSLNRDELVEKRVTIINDFYKSIESYELIFNRNSEIDKKEAVKYFIDIIEIFIKKCKKENEFYALRYFMLSNISIFIDNEDMVKIIEYLFKKYGLCNEK